MGRHNYSKRAYDKTYTMPCNSVWLFWVWCHLLSLAVARIISDTSYLWAWKLDRNETLHIHVQHGKLLQLVQYRSHLRQRRSWMWGMLDQKVWSTRHKAVRHDGQLVTRFYSVMSWLVPVHWVSRSSKMRNSGGVLRSQENGKELWSPWSIRTPTPWARVLQNHYIVANLM